MSKKIPICPNCGNTVTTLQAPAATIVKSWLFVEQCWAEDDNTQLTFDCDLQILSQETCN